MATTSTSLLDLPLSVRQEIYAFCDLVRTCPMVFHEPKRYLGEAYKECPDSRLGKYSYAKRLREATDTGELAPCCWCPRLPFELLLVFKSIYKEVSHMLYSQNKFILNRFTGADLAPLLSLASTDLASMTSLLVRLNNWPCSWRSEGGCITRPKLSLKCTVTTDVGRGIDSSV